MYVYAYIDTYMYIYTLSIYLFIYMYIYIHVYILFVCRLCTDRFPVSFEIFFLDSYICILFVYPSLYRSISLLLSDFPLLIQKAISVYDGDVSRLTDLCRQASASHAHTQTHTQHTHTHTHTHTKKLTSQNVCRQSSLNLLLILLRASKPYSATLKSLSSVSRIACGMVCVCRSGSGSGVLCIIFVCDKCVCLRSMCDFVCPICPLTHTHKHTPHTYTHTHTHTHTHTKTTTRTQQQGIEM